MYPRIPIIASPPQDAQPRKGRGTTWDLPHRFTTALREDFDDGWGRSEPEGPDAAQGPATQIAEEHARSILSANDSPDIGFDLSINRYKEVVHEEVEHPDPLDIISDLEKLEEEIQQGLAELKAMLT